MTFFRQLSPNVQGYLLVFFTMCVWGSFSLFSRINVHWGIAAWDVIALRFAISATILLVAVCLSGQWRFLLNPKAVLLAFFGGGAYSCLVYSAFMLAPVAHGAVFLSGMIPFITALLLFVFHKKRPDTDTQLAFVIIAITLLAMTILMLKDGLRFGVGDGLFVLCALCWSIYSLMLKAWHFSAWQIVCSTAIWSAVLYLPIYVLFLNPSLDTIATHHLLIQGAFHGVVVTIIATLTYALAVERLGAFVAGGLSSLAPFIAAIVAVPLLNEPLNHILVLGLIGMGLGTVQPWRFVRNYLQNRPSRE